MSIVVPAPSSFKALVHEAARTLESQGWKIVRCRMTENAVWHLVARKGQKLRVVQLVAPSSPAHYRQAQRLALGETIGLPYDVGLMEQWLAHRRPDGRCTFGPYVLSSQRWSDTATDAAEKSLSRLGL